MNSNATSKSRFAPGALQYIVFRLIRKFVFSNSLTYRVKKIFPFFVFKNHNEFDPGYIAEHYFEICRHNKIDLTGKTILELGTGSTNSTGYYLASKIKLKYSGYEPFVKFNRKLDNLLYKKLKGSRSEFNRSSVKRYITLEDIEPDSIDIILSNSVLEHVADLDQLLTDITRVSKKTVTMVHNVDYRDHFFKFPYHFLTFSAKTWNRFLNPGSLPRWRISHHIDRFMKFNYNTTVVNRENLKKEFESISQYLHDDFKSIPPEDCSVSVATLIVKPA